MSTRKIYLPVALIVSALLALYLGFFAYGSADAVQIIKHGGYWVMLLTWGLLVLNLSIRLYRSKCWEGCGRRIHDNWQPFAFVGLASILLYVMQPTGYKITMDEPVLSATALRMHEYKEVMTTIRAHEIQGVFTQLDGYVDKRPYFYPFLLSLVHDFIGYRSSNTFLLNALLTPLFLGLLFVVGRMAWPRFGGYASVLLFMTVPLLAMNVNGGGFELLNLVMILAAALAGKIYLERSSTGALDAFILLGLLLAQTRYESVLYVVAVGVVVAIGWWRARQIILSPVTVLAPLLLIPFPLQQIIFSDYQGLWQLKDGAEQPFMLSLIPANLGHAYNYFFNIGDDQQPNSLILSVLFVLSLGIALPFFVRGLRSIKAASVSAMVAFPFIGIVAANFLLLMAYHWGQVDDIIATRIVLPFILLQVLTVVYVMGRVVRSDRFASASLLVVSVYVMAFTIPLCARSDFLRWVPDQHQVLWLQKQVVERRDQSVLWVTNKHLVALIERTPAIAALHAKTRKQQLDLHLQMGSYGEILFVYPTSVHPDEMSAEMRQTGLELDFDLEPLRVEKIGRNLYMCMSRLKSVKWLESDAHDFSIPDTAGIIDAEAKLQSYAQTLP